MAGGIKERRRREGGQGGGPLWGQRQGGGGGAVGELLLLAAGHDQRRDARTAQKPAQRDAGRRDAPRLAYRDESLDQIVEPRLVADWRLAPVGEVAGALGARLAPAVLAGQEAAG